MPPLFDRILFYFLLAVLAARPLIGESYERVDLAFLSDLPATGTTPATTAWLDALLLAGSVLALARGDRWRRNRLWALGIGLLGVAVLVSSAAAGDKLLARLAGASLVIGVLAGVALSSLLQARWMRHLLLATLLATGCATALKCISQCTREFADTQRYWEETYKPQLVKQGFELDDPVIVNYERRMAARLATGFLSHTNVTGSCLMMWLIVSAGLLAALLSERRRVWPLLVAGLLCVLLAVGLGLTRSRGAIIGTGAGVVALVALGLAADWAGRHARRVLTFFAIGYLGLIGSGATYGVTQGTLPHTSLAFSWHYWNAAARAYLDAPLTGLGRQNFATAYMRYKPAESTEEVRDPHNLWVTLLVELGPLGLAGGVLLASLCLLAGFRSLAPPADEITPADSNAPSARTILTRATPVAVGVLFVHALFSGTTLSDPDMRLLWALEVLRNWTLPFLVCVWLFSTLDRAGARSAAWLAAGLCAALLASIVHHLIDFAVLTPGGLAVLVMCAAGAAGVRALPQRECASRPALRWTPILLLGLGAAFVFAHLYVICAPVYAATHGLLELDAKLHASPPSDPQSSYTEASVLAARNFGDAEAFRYAVRTMLQLSRWPSLADKSRLTWLGQTSERALALARFQPNDTANHALLAAVQQELARTYERTGHSQEARQAQGDAAESWGQAVQCYPTNPRTRISAGKAWYELWKTTGAGDAARQARAQLVEARRIDDTRPEYEVARLRPRERAEVEALLGELASGAAPSTTPATTRAGP